MTKINPTAVFVQPETLVNPASLRDGLGWFVYGIAAHVRGEKLEDKALCVVRDTVYALRNADIMLPDPLHEVEREYPHETRAFSFLHPYGFKMTLLEDFMINDRIIINQTRNLTNVLVISRSTHRTSKTHH